MTRDDLLDLCDGYRTHLEAERGTPAVVRPARPVRSSR